MTTSATVLKSLLREPGDLLLRQWNWKSALYSSLIRSALFFAVNLDAGISAAGAAMLTEMSYRALTAGFYGSLTQSFRKVEPRWQGTLAALALLMLVSHSLELAVHWLRGTPNLGASIAASACFTLLSTLFNLHAMRRGVFVTGGDSQSFAADLRQLPQTFWSFATGAPRLLGLLAERIL